MKVCLVLCKRMGEEHKDESLLEDEHEKADTQKAAALINRKGEKHQFCKFKIVKESVFTKRCLECTIVIIIEL